MSSGGFFLLPFGEHCEYVLQVLRKQGKIYQASSVTVACCQNSPVEEHAVKQAIAANNNEALGEGNWCENKRPERRDTVQSPGNCANKFDEAKALLSIAPSDLRRRIIDVSEIQPGFIGTFKAEKQRQQELQDLFDVVTALKEHDLERNTMIMLQASKIIGRIYKGLEALQRERPATLSTICQLIDARGAEARDVEHVFDAAEKTDQKGKKGKWMAFHANISRAVKRAAELEAERETNRQTRTYPLRKLDKSQRAQQKRYEKLPTSILSIVDRLLSKVGGQALLVCRAFQIECFVFKETARLIIGSEIPTLEHYITCRLEIFDFSTIMNDLDIECPLSLISWGRKETVDRVCGLLVLPNFQQIKLLDVSEKMDKLERNWKTTVKESRFRLDAEWRLQQQAMLEHNTARVLKVSLCDLRTYYPQSSELQALNRLADVTLRGDSTGRAQDLSQTVDSGYGTDVVESMAGTQQLRLPQVPRGYTSPFDGHQTVQLGSDSLSQHASSQYLPQNHVSSAREGPETQLRNDLDDDPPSPPSTPRSWTCDPAPAMYFPSNQQQTPMLHPSNPSIFSPAHRFVVADNDVSLPDRRSTSPPSSQLQTAAIRRPASDGGHYFHSSKRPRLASHSKAQNVYDNHEGLDSTGQRVVGRHYDPVHDRISSAIRFDAAAIEIAPTELHTTALVNDECSLSLFEAPGVVEEDESVHTNDLHSLAVEGGGGSADGTHISTATSNNDAAEQALTKFMDGVASQDNPFSTYQIDEIIAGHDGWWGTPVLTPSTPVQD